jgi:hypothetical protein
MGVKTLIVCDPATNDPLKDAEDIASYLEDAHGIVLDWTHLEAVGVKTLGEIKPDFIVLDYGGTSMAYGNSGYVQVAEFVKWAKEHPSKLLLIYTSHTMYMVDDVLDFEDAPDNVMEWVPDPLKTKKKYFDHQDEIALKIRHWYGMPEPEEPDPDQYKLDLKKPGRG